MLRLDMSEYMERHSVAKLIGAPPGGTHCLLTAFVPLQHCLCWVLIWLGRVFWSSVCCILIPVALSKGVLQHIAANGYKFTYI